MHYVILEVHFIGTYRWRLWLVVTVTIPLGSSNLAAANIVKTLSIRFQNNDLKLEYIQ